MTSSSPKSLLRSIGLPTSGNPIRNGRRTPAVGLMIREATIHRFPYVIAFEKHEQQLQGCDSLGAFHAAGIDARRAAQSAFEAGSTGRQMTGIQWLEIRGNRSGLCFAAIAATRTTLSDSLNSGGTRSVPAS